MREWRGLPKRCVGWAWRNHRLSRRSSISRRRSRYSAPIESRQRGEMFVPAGAKAVGHIRSGDRSGYVDIQFDSLLMPDGAVVPIEAAATDLDLRPLKGKVEGKNTGKNVLVRSLSGIGQAGAMLVGQGSLNQPLNESDLIRERVGSNIGEAGDEEVSRLAITQHIVVTISVDTPIYVVLEQSPKSNQVSVQR